VQLTPKDFERDDEDDEARERGEATTKPVADG
jgi:hypothetical protein